MKQITLLLTVLIATLCSVNAKSYEPKQSRQYLKPADSKYTKTCHFDEVSFLVPVNCSGHTIENSNIPNNTSCIFRQIPDNSEPGTLDLRERQTNVIALVCHDGHWSGTDYSVGHPVNRQKRLFGIVAAFVGSFVVGAVVGYYACKYLCPPSVVQVPVMHYPPEFPNPCKPNDVRENYIVAAGEKATVSWTDIPKATDRNGDTPTVELYSGGSNGGQYSGHENGKVHTITYLAKDETGLKGYCSFTFTVTEATCSSPPWIVNGIRNCDDFRVGMQCQYMCLDGHEIVGNSIITCENVDSPSWTSVPTCEKTTCDAPRQLDHGHVTCPSYDYQSLCTMSCDPKYQLKGQIFTQCQSDGTWLRIANSSCVDNTPPSLVCQTPQVFYADRGSSATSVTWEEPQVTDTTDPSPTLIKTSGPNMGDIISGTEYVSYMAIDADGNMSPNCTVELRVQEIPCGHPSNTLLSNNLVFDCSDTRYVYGVSCLLSCFANLPLNGSNVITCEKDGDDPVGIWDWGSGTQPFCEDISCPELDQPINGALVYDTIETRPVYTMMCNDQHDIPYVKDFQGMFFCLDNKKGWQPTGLVPDCTEANGGPSRLKLPGVLFYYSGDCGTPEAMAEIEENFVGVVQSGISSYFVEVCPPGETCNLENIVIRCGAIQKRDVEVTKDHNQITSRRLLAKTSIQSREKRQVESATLVVSIDIVVDVTIPAGESIWSVIDYYDSIIADLSSAMQTMLVSGTLDLNNFTLYNDSWSAPDYADMACKTGFILDGSTCKPCPLGQYLDETTTECILCAAGEYSDGEGIIACTQCPEGTSTKHNGSKSVDYCIDQCGPGTMSPDGMLPCASCLYGEYQDESGQTVCKQCPSGTTTHITNAASIQNCHSYDILIGETNEHISVANMLDDMNSLTIMMWAKRVDEQTHSTRFQLKSSNVDIMTLYLTETIRVNVPNLVDEEVAALSSVTWTHFAVVWDTSVNRVYVYINGNEALSTSVSSNNTLISNGELTVFASGQSGIYLTGFHLFDKVLDAADITTYSSTCHITSTEDIVDTGNFRNYNSSGILVIESSNCDSVDNCQPDPCNRHMCIDGQDTFSCHCYSGWSGATCLVPPDHCIDNECDNGATCLNGNSSYTCDCLPGYTGTLCDIPPVDGGWSEWQVISGCTQECGSGTMNRTRTCDNPPPDPYGADCVGDATESVSCNTAACHVCEDLPIRNDTQVSCITDMATGTRTCTVYCDDTKVMQPELQDNLEYECGPKTNYEWSNVETLPSCIEPTAPTSVSITTSIEYTINIPEYAVSDITATISSNFASTHCASDCDIPIMISGNRLTVTYSKIMSEESDLQLDDYDNTGTVSASLQELVEAVVSLELTAQYLQNNTADMFDVVVNGVSYISDTSSLTSTGIVTCPSGQVVREGACVRCPAGTYSNGVNCDYCERGTYQPTSGASSCMSCPSPFTTETIGSTDLSQCSELTTARPTTPTTPEPGKPSKNIIILVAVVPGVVAIVISTIAIICVCCRHCRCCRSNTRRSSSVASLSGGVHHVGPLPHTTQPNGVFKRPTTTSKISFTLDNEGKIADNERYSRNPCDGGYLTPQTRDISSPPPPYMETDLPPYSAIDNRRSEAGGNTYHTIKDVTCNRKVDILTVEDYD